MIGSNHAKTTRLTEIQARALADWWKGRYEARKNPEKFGEAWHGVVFQPLDPKDPSVPPSPKLAIFSLEEARALENVRGAVNPEAPDWVG
jgi:hypothetical protein